MPRISHRGIGSVRLPKLLKVLILFVCAVAFVVGLHFALTAPPSIDRPQQLHPKVAGAGALISYENTQLNEQDQRREGYGERGQAVRLHGTEKKKSEQYVNQNGFNTYISDLIALDRSVADIRHSKCKTMQYLVHLPSVSVIIPFFEENLNALLRTVKSSLKRAPKGVIKEFVLVDDGSSRPYLKSQLDDYVSSNFPTGLVRIIRSPKREGLIRARIRGARAASGEVLVFLDSHCEPNPNWLPPLIDPIVRDPKTVTCPFIDVIDADTFEYRAQDEGARGAFDWELYYKRLPKLKSDEAYPEKPFYSPVMAGGLFAISAKWFWELGGYDPGLQIWGGEQYELSFKIWMCGGQMIDIPCSRIGHIYRKHPTDFPDAGIGDFLGRNYKRVAEVWMDEYKEYIYKRRPHYRVIDPGDLSEQLALRKRLNCKSFHWFMTEIAFDLVKKYPLVDPIPAAIGDIRSAVDQTMCIDALGASQTVPIKLNKCIRDGGNQNGLQNFEFSYHDDIRPIKLTFCFDLPNAYGRAPVVLYDCHGEHGNQYWSVQPVNNDGQNPVRLRHVPSNYCIEGNTEQQAVMVRRCDPESRGQQWIWQTLQFEEAAKTRKLAGL